MIWAYMEGLNIQTNPYQDFAGLIRNRHIISLYFRTDILLMLVWLVYFLLLGYCSDHMEN